MPQSVLNELLEITGLQHPGDDMVRITGSDPVVKARYKVGTLSAASQAALGIAAADLWKLRTGRQQRIDIDLRVAAYGLYVMKYTFLNGKHLRALEPYDPFLGFYPVKNDRWFRIQTGFPHLRETMLDLLGRPKNVEEADKVTRTWDGQELEDALVAAGGCGGLVRTAEEWAKHPQSAAIAAQPLVEIRKIGDAPPRPLPEGDRPLAGIRVLDLTRVIAGPICGRTLAEQGADVMKINSPNLDNSGYGELEPGLGKLAAFVDLTTADGRETLQRLLREADVFSQGYRPGALAGLGFSPEDAARLRPGIVYTELSAFGFQGPWKGRRGYDPVIQSANGMIRQPKPGERAVAMPVAPIDFLTGYMMALGTMVALRRRATEGGSWHVRTSLARVGQWLKDAGEFPDSAIENIVEPSLEEIKPLSTEMDGPLGHMEYMKPVIQMSETPPHLVRPAVKVGYSPAVWPAFAGAAR